MGGCLAHESAIVQFEQQMRGWLKFEDFGEFVESHLDCGASNEINASTLIGWYW
jgi:hypothetical protein